MERLLYHTVVELLPKFDVGICGPKGCSAFAPPSGPISEIPPKPLSRFLLESFFQGLLVASRWRPHIVFAGSGLTALTALIIGRLLGTRTAVYVHGLDVVARQPIYRGLFLPAIRHCDLVLANSESTCRLAVAAGIDDHRIRLLHPGVEMPKEADPGAITQFRAQLGVADRPILLSVGRLTPRKGVAEFVESSLPAIVKAFPQTLLLIVGAPANDSAAGSSDEVLQRIDRAIALHRLDRNVMLLGSVNDETLHLAFGAASALVFPVIEVRGDVEGFGMVAVEAAAHGLPTVAFSVGGVPEAVAHRESGLLVDPGAYGEFAQSCNAVLGGTVTFRGSRAFAERFAWPAFGQRLRRFMTELAATNETS